MRLPWFFGSWPGGRRPLRRKNQRAQRPSTPSLRVRQLERRRVLDAAAQSLVVGPMLDAGQESTVTTPVTTAEPLVFNWTASTTGSDSAAAVNAFGAAAQGGGQSDGPQAFGVPNTDPVVIAALDQQINEGQFLDLSGTDGASPLGLLLDPDTGDTHTATVNWGDGTGDQMATVIGSGTAKPLGATHTYADGDAPFTDYTVTVTVSDGVGAPASDTFVVRVYNVDPTLTISGAPNVNEGSPYTLNLSSSDPGDDTISSWEINWGDGNIETVLGDPSSATHTYEDGDANYTITATATDEDGTYAAGNSVLVMVDNVAPTITAINLSDLILDEGESLTIKGTFTDPALGVPTETFTVLIDWGNGSTSMATVDSTLGTFTATYLYADDHPITGTPQDTFSITVTVTDDDGGSTSNASDSVFGRSVTIMNVAPTITAVNLSDVMLDEGQSLTVSGTFSDPALGVVTESFTVMIDWGNGDTTLAVVDAALGTYTATYLYQDDHPSTGTLQDTFAIVVMIADDDGGSFSSATDPGLDRSVIIKNVAPTVALGSVSAINENGTATLTGSYTDIGLLDQHVVTIGWGDPNDSQVSTFNIPAIQDAAGTPTLSVGQTFVSSTDEAVLTVTAINATTGQVSFSVQHRYLDDGLAPGNGTTSDTSTITVTVADDDTGSNSATASVLVQNVAPTIVLGSVSAINENGTATLAGSFTDIGLLDQHVVTVNWFDPNDTQLSTFNVTAIRNAAGTTTLTVGQTFVSSTDEAVLTVTAINSATGQVNFSVQHQYLDDGLAPGNNTASDPTTIIVTVADDDTGTNFATSSVVVNNVAPTVVLGSVSAINENGSATLTGSYTDIGLLDGHVVTVNWGDPNDLQLSTFSIPAIRDAAGTATLLVGQTFVSSTDEAVITITAINSTTGQVSFSVQHRYLDDGLAPGNNTASDTSTISVTVADDDTGSNVATATVLVQNVGPTISLGGVSSINENGLATLTGTYTDIGLLDQHVVTINWGDPNDAQLSTFSIAAIRDAAGTATLTVGQMFASSTDEAVLTITAVNAISGQVSFSVQHQYLDDGLAPGNNTASDTNTISVTVADDDTGSNGASTTVVVQNVAPTVALGGVSATLENGTATLTGSYTDIGLLDQHVVTVNWGDPNDAQLATFAITAIRNAAGVATLTVGQTFNSSTDEAVFTVTAINATTGQVSFSVQHQYLDDGLALGNNTASDTSTIQVTVADDDTGSNVATATVLVQNVAPTVVLGSVSAVNENGTATLTGSYTDIGLLDQHALTINWGDPNDAQLSTFAVTAIRNAAGTATLTVGQTFVSSTDEGVLTITAINATTGQVSFSVQHQYLDDGLAPGNNTASDTSTITVSVADDDTGSNVATATVLVQNVAPTVALGGVSAIFENGTATLTGSYTDIGLLDQHVVTINWGDSNDAQLATFAITAIRNAAGAATLTVGQTFSSSTDEAVLTITAINATTGQVSFSVQHQYLDDGLAPGNNTASDTSTIQVTVADDDTGSNTATTTVLVQNVAPTIVLGSVSAINENGTATLTGSYTDIGLLDQHVVTINWNDPNDAQLSTFAVTAIRNAAGTATLTVGQTFVSSTDEGVLTITAINATTGQVSFSVQHQYLDDGLAPGNNTANDTSTIQVTVADDDTGSNAATTTVLINNVAPNVALGSVSAINENGTATLTGSYTDIGLLDQHVVTINWGDPNDAELSTFSITPIRNAAGAATLTVGQTFNSSTDEAVLTITAINATTGQVNFSVQHQYLDDGPAPGNNTASDTSTITVTVADDDTASNIASTAVLVQNVTPILTVSGPFTRDEGQLLNLSGMSGALTVASFTDVGTLDLHAAQIDWGDGHVEIGMVNQGAGSGTITGTHTYADDGVYTVVVRLADDDMSAFTTASDFNTGVAGVAYVQATFTVTVVNVAPSLTDGSPTNVVDEGSAFVLSDLGGGEDDLGIGLSDPGFDNPLNPTTPALGNPFFELFAGYMIDWGDGTADTPVTVVMRNNGAPNSPTTARFEHAAHTYADNGVYTVRVRIADDNMGAFSDSSKFVTGTPGVDFVDLEFTITVENVSPTLGIPVASAGTINENGSVNFSVTFSDPGFDNPFNDNAPPNGGEVAETFTYDIDWGDNRQTLGNVAVDATNGAVGIPSEGSFGGSHIYADDGTYTVTITIHDDDGGVHTRKINVIVENTNPLFTPLPNGDSFEGDDISSEGITTIRVSYHDAGFDNPANPNAPVLPNISNPLHESFTHLLNWGDGSIDALHTYVDPGTYTVSITVSGANLNDTFTFNDFVGGQTSLLTLVSGQTLNVPGATAYTYEINWGDGTIQTVTLTLNQPLAPLAVSDRTIVLAADRVSGNEGIDTTGSFEVQHTYLGPPNPANPTADIAITVSIVDDNNGAVSDTIFVPNPGINTINVAIDTTPQVPRLEFAPTPTIQALLNQSSATIQSLQSNEVGAGGGETAVSSERFLELVAYAPDGTEIAREPLDEEELADLRGLFARLPDGHYKIFLVRTDNNSRRLVMEVYVRRGRVIDPSDDSEGTRDRPPTSESEQQKEAAPQEDPQVDPAADAVSDDSVMLPAASPVSDSQSATGALLFEAAANPSPQPPAPNYNSLRWGASLAGLAMAAGGARWSRKVDAAFEQADHRAWQRLRRAGRLGGASSRANRADAAATADRD